MEMEESFSAQDPEFLSSAGSGVDWQPDTQQVETISEDSEQLSKEAESVSSEPNQVSADLGRMSSQLAFITFRRQLLHNRRIMLLKMQQFRNKRKDREALSPTVSFPEESEPTELQAIEQELQDLVDREQELLQIQTDNIGPDHTPLSDYTEKLMAPYQGVYVLPSNTPENMKQYTQQATPPAAPEDIVEVEKLNSDPAIVQCPICEQVVTTETYRKIGGAAWMLCLVSGMLGCVAGCCLIPFCLDNLKDVRHRCPECHGNIYTAERM
ncbi:cell death-inducing p53-target protein 1 homolog [Salmo trutta]|uniref:Cell death-inducing p53-target protein 1 homolog n=1 Tax=Salmo trutta TaxID=8032 RepID=A0A674D0V0_SALTR|nr:cell death-inducing p53-target protein 1 homolog [Salmo trutta]